MSYAWNKDKYVIDAILNDMKQTCNYGAVTKIDIVKNIIRMDTTDYRDKSIDGIVKEVSARLCEKFQRVEKVKTLINKINDFSVTSLFDLKDADDIKKNHIFKSGIRKHYLYLDSRYSDKTYGKIDNIYKNAHRWYFNNVKPATGSIYTKVPIANIIGMQLYDSVIQLDATAIDPLNPNMTVLVQELENTSHKTASRSYHFSGVLYDYNLYNLDLVTAPTTRAKYILRVDGLDANKIEFIKPVQCLDHITIDVGIPYDILTYPDSADSYVLDNVNNKLIAFFYFSLEIICAEDI